MSFTAVVEKETIKLPAGVHLPDRTEVTVEPLANAAQAPARPRATLAERLSEFIGVADDLPPDLAINRDHYLHGAPKQKP